MRILGYLTLTLFLSCTNQMTRFLPSEKLEDYLFKRNRDYSMIMVSNWGTGDHTIYQIPISVNKGTEVKKVDFFYYNLNYPLDSVDAANIDLSKSSIQEANRLLELMSETAVALPSLEASDRIIVAGGKAAKILIGRKTITFDNLCTAIKLRIELGEDTSQHCQLNQLKENLWKVLGVTNDETCSCNPPND